MDASYQSIHTLVSGRSSGYLYSSHQGHIFFAAYSHMNGLQYPHEATDRFRVAVAVACEAARLHRISSLLCFGAAKEWSGGGGQALSLRGFQARLGFGCLLCLPFDFLLFPCGGALVWVCMLSRRQVV